MTDDAQPPGTVPAAVPGAPYASLYAALMRAFRCEIVWVMDLEHYKQIRRTTTGYRPADQDEDKWVPSIDDRLIGQRIIVRDDGGEPHIEWMTRKEMGP